MHSFLLALIVWLFLLLPPWQALAEATPTPLTLIAGSAHELRLQVLEGGVFEIDTEGRDPFVLSAPLSEGAAPPSLSVLAFEYFCPDGLDHFEVFYGPPIQGGRSIKTAPVPRAEIWTPFAVNLRELSRGNWDGSARLYRLDFGSKAGVRLQLRNVCLREPSAAEIAQKEATEAELRRKHAQAEQINAYLQTNFANRVTAVQVRRDQIEISGRLGSAQSGRVQLAELGMFEEPWRPSTKNVVAEVVPSADGAFRVQLPRQVESVDRLFSRWQLVVTGEDGIQKAASHALHATELPPADGNGGAVLSPRTKKGMGGVTLNQISGELQELGVEHVTLNLVLNSFFRPFGGPDTEPYEFEGRTYAISKGVVAGLDRSVAFYGKFSVISGILLQGLPKAPRERALVNHPEANAEAPYSMPNLTSAEGVHAYRAALSFLARRYAGGEHGCIPNWILHNEVDQAWAWTNMGEQPMEVVMDHYARSLRLAYYTARAAYSKARVFLSLTHHWAYPKGESLGNYRPKDMLERMATYSRLEGDFEWGVAYHPYPQSLFHAATWNDKLALHTFDTPHITPKNIEVLDAYLQKPHMLYLGKHTRGVLLSEQGFHAAPDSLEAQRLQAAALVYTWHKIRPLKSIEAFHNHRWIDAAEEGGLLLGLRSLPEPGKPFGERKYSWKVYQSLDTPDEAAASSFALEILGIRDFSEIPQTTPVAEH